MNYWLVLPLNPEPWRVGPVGVTRKNGLRGFVGKDAQLEAYKEAVREAAEYDLREQGIDPESVMIEGAIELHLSMYLKKLSAADLSKSISARTNAIETSRSLELRTKW